MGSVPTGAVAWGVSVGALLVGAAAVYFLMRD
jgi:hypothetical protein